MIYFDNAATSWPKPRDTISAMVDFNTASGSSPGRSGHSLSIAAARIVYNARESAAELTGAENPQNIIFTKNATEALNLSILGLLKTGDHAILTGMEHNSVVRPLRLMEQKGIELSIVECSERGELNPADLKKLIKKNTRVIYMTHASNVCGTIMPVEDVGEISEQYGLIFCVDAAQTCGVLNINVKNMNADLLAFTGHKSMYGPQGTGGLYINDEIAEIVNPIMLGGTGSRSELEEQPDFLPDKFESGTLNAIGIAGLGGGLKYLAGEGLENIRGKEKKLTARFIDGSKTIKGINIYGPDHIDSRISVVSFNIMGLAPSEVSEYLDESFEIFSRPGLHCSPLAHKTIGTFPEGTVRFSFGYFNTEAEIDDSLAALDKLAASVNKKNQ